MLVRPYFAIIQYNISFAISQEIILIFFKNVVLSQKRAKKCDLFVKIYNEISIGV